MPRPPRPKVVGRALIPGLRMDKELEAAFLAYAETQAKAHDVPVNLLSAARDLLRRALKMNPRHSCEKEGFYKGIADARKKMAEALTGDE